MADKLAEYSTATGASATPAPIGAGGATRQSFLTRPSPGSAGMESPLFNSPTARTRALASRKRAQRGPVQPTSRRGGHPDPESEAKLAALQASQARLEAAFLKQQSHFASRFDRLEKLLMSNSSSTGSNSTPQVDTATSQQWIVFSYSYVLYSNYPGTRNMFIGSLDRAHHIGPGSASI
jgi:hypothetical protein